MHKYKLALLILFTCKQIFSINIGLTSIPKCGTYLLVKCIESLVGKKGTNIDGTSKRNLNNIAKYNFFYCHLAYSKEFEFQLKRHNFKIFFIYRDPRDQIVSHAFWVKKIYPGYKDYNVEKLITMLIKFVKPLYNAFLPWLKSDIVCPVKFENMVGSKGNGSDILQRKEINKICKHLKAKSKKIKNRCIKSLFGESYTFRKGQIGEWKDYFTKEHKDLFKKLASTLLIELDYEKDNNW